MPACNVQDVTQLNTIAAMEFATAAATQYLTVLPVFRI
jgi:hypothetical protein